MTKYEEIYLLSALISNAKPDNTIDLENPDIWKSFFFTNETKIHEDYFLKLNDNGFLNYEEVGDEGFKAIRICSIIPETKTYLKQLIVELQNSDSEKQNQIDVLNRRVNEILTFDPNKLSKEIETTEKTIKDVKEQLTLNPVLQSLLPQLKQIEIHFSSLSKVANHYEDVYKNIILPVKEEGKSGVRQTVKWAIISIIISTIFSIIITWVTK